MKTEKRKDVKPSSQLTARLSARVSEEAFNRLFTHSLMDKQTAGEILDRLIKTSLRTYRVQVNPTAQARSIDRHGDAPCVTDSAALPALSDAA